MPDGSAPPRVQVITPASWDEQGFDRAWDLGYAAGLQALRSLVVFVERADRALAKLSAKDRKAIWAQALYDVAQEHGELPLLVRKAIAAQRIAELAER